MAGRKYLGPSDTLQLEEDGKVYHPGDVVPISAELAQHMADQGHHRFEGIEPETLPVSGAVETVDPNAPKPAEDRPAARK